jgi:cytochrome c peroxidase
VFRVAMLRNIAKTAPYFHDGSVDTLERAVRVMATVQLGKTLDDATAASIAAFLETLTGEVPANYAPVGQRP